jgi:hypothetical protein
MVKILSLRLQPDVLADLDLIVRAYPPDDRSAILRRLIRGKAQQIRAALARQAAPALQGTPPDVVCFPGPAPTLPALPADPTPDPDDQSFRCPTCGCVLDTDARHTCLGCPRCHKPLGALPHRCFA